MLITAQGLGLSSNRQQQQKKTIYGDGLKAPCCVNKCFSCRPCMVTLVVPSDQKKSLTFKALSHGDNDDNGS